MKPRDKLSECLMALKTGELPADLQSAPDAHLRKVMLALIQRMSFIESRVRDIEEYCTYGCEAAAKAAALEECTQEVRAPAVRTKLQIVRSPGDDAA